MYTMLKESLSDIPNKKILTYEGKTINANKFLYLIDFYSNILKQEGVNKGDVVAVNLPNCAHAIILFYAINKCGAVVNSIHPKVPFKAYNNFLIETKTRLVITYKEFYFENIKEFNKTSFKYYVCNISLYFPLLKRFFYNLITPKLCNEINFDKIEKITSDNEIIKNDVAIYLHSSGTTGQPKTVVLSNDALNNLSISLEECIDQNPNIDKCISVLPLFHGFGLGVCMHTILTNKLQLILLTRFNNKTFANNTKKYKATLCAGVPAMYEKLLKLNDNDFKKLKSLKFVFVGGDSLPMYLKTQFDNKLKRINSQAELLEGYGLTETVTVCTINKFNDYEVGSVGYPLSCCSIKIVDDKNNLLKNNEKGFICICGTTLMEGYLNSKNPFIYIDNKKYINTGDYGFLNDDGKLFFLNREKRVFKINGVPIFPQEIETLACTNSNVKIAVAIEVNNSYNLFVELFDKNNQNFVEKELFEIFRSNLISYAIPRKILFIDSFPRNDIGKIMIDKISG